MPATLAEWLARLEAAHPSGSDGIELGLDRVATVKQVLGQRETVPVILVGGTNGKGSTCAMLERILATAGYRVGLYTSPHLLRYNERIRVGGRAVADEAICAAFGRVEQARGDTPLTYFEFGTLAAWEVFSQSGTDCIILEVGLGGRLDATNAYEPDCAVVTSVDLDHMEFLGHDREAIGAEKAGIFRSGKPAICADPSPPRSLLAHAERLNVPLALLGRDYGYSKLDAQWSYWSRAADGDIFRRGGLAHPGLRGDVQLVNAATALRVLEALHERLPVAMKDIRQGLVELEFPGRFQTLPGRPTVVLDVAHNPQAARVLAANLGATGFFPRTRAVFGMLADKDIDGVIDALRGRVTDWLPCTLDGRRAATADFLAERLAAAGIPVAERFSSVAEGLLRAREQADEGDRIVAFGSFLTVAAALQALGREV